MSRLSRPELPSLVEAAVEAFGNRVRVAVLLSLHEHGPSTNAELHRHLGGSQASVHKHLMALEDAGVVLASPPRTDERGPVTRYYRVNPDRVDVLIDALATAVKGLGSVGSRSN